MQATTQMAKKYLVASDFDQTLSFHDSGAVLSELVGISSKDFERKTAILSAQNLVQQGGELAYLLLHDREFRVRVGKEHFGKAGKKIRLKKNIKRLHEMLAGAIDGYHFEFHVISAAPQEIVESALEGIIAPDHIHGTLLEYDEAGGIAGLIRVNAGYGKVAVLDDLQAALRIGSPRIVYIGDGSSDIHVMLHLNQREGFTVAVSQARSITQIAKRTVLSDDALSVLIPILEEIVGWGRPQIRALFEAQGLVIQDWDRAHADWLTIRSTQPVQDAAREESAPSPTSS
ncbi:MAG: haloacid dehalogenase-like hydrolase [Terriglobia bacterium]|jgi:phosphoserine phosphatase